MVLSSSAVPQSRLVLLPSLAVPQSRLVLSSLAEPSGTMAQRLKSSEEALKVVFLLLLVLSQLLVMVLAWLLRPLLHQWASSLAFPFPSCPPQQHHLRSKRISNRGEEATARVQGRNQKNQMLSNQSSPLRQKTQTRTPMDRCHWI